jgi:PAS domain-containing protein
MGSGHWARLLSLQGHEPLSEEVRVPRLDISLASVDVVTGPPPALRVVQRAPERPTDWYAVVAAASEPCLLLDSDGLIGAVSAPFLRLFGFAAAEDALGRGLLDDLLDFVDFSAGPSRLETAELERLPPLQSLRSGGLARGLLRVRVGGGVSTIDAVTTPIRAGGQVSGSLTFFAVV